MADGLNLVVHSHNNFGGAASEMMQLHAPQITAFLLFTQTNFKSSQSSTVSAGSEWTFAPISLTSGMNFPAARPDREAET